MPNYSPLLGNVKPFFLFFVSQYLAKLPNFLASALWDVLAGMQFADVAWRGKAAKADGAGLDWLPASAKVNDFDFPFDLNFDLDPCFDSNLRLDSSFNPNVRFEEGPRSVDRGILYSTLTSRQDICDAGPCFLSIVYNVQIALARDVQIKLRRLCVAYFKNEPRLMRAALLMPYIAHVYEATCTRVLSVKVLRMKMLGGLSLKSVTSYVTQ